MEPGGSMRIRKGAPVIPILSWINWIPGIDTYLFKIDSNILSHLRLGLPTGIFPVGLPVKILKVLLPSYILAMYNGIYFNKKYWLNRTILGYQKIYEATFSVGH